MFKRSNKNVSIILFNLKKNYYKKNFNYTKKRNC